MKTKHNAKRYTLKEYSRQMVKGSQNPVIKRANQIKKQYFYDLEFKRYIPAPGPKVYEPLCFEFADLESDMKHVVELNTVMSERVRHILLCLPTVREMNMLLLVTRFKKERYNKLSSLMKIVQAREADDETIKPQGKYEKVIKEKQA